jgi:hypothetical protein
MSALEFEPYIQAFEHGYIEQSLYNWYAMGPGVPSLYAAAVSLPNGATVTKMVIYFWDDADTVESGLPDVSASLLQVSLDGQSITPIVSVSSSGRDASYRSAEAASTSEALVDQQHFMYVVEVGLPRSYEVRLRGVRIDYAHQVSLPLVMKD